MLRNTLVFLLLIFPCLLSGQTVTRTDSLGAQFTTALLSPEELAIALCTDLDSEYDKARIIFSWLAHHITYDLEAARNSRPERILYRTQAELEKLLAQRKRARMRTALRDRKGVCEDYSELYVAMCQAVGLAAGKIDGYVVHHPDKMGRQPLTSNHVWNWVTIEGRKCLVDITYAAGATDWSGTAFRQKYDPVWFDVSPEIMVQTHYPEQSAEQLLAQPLTGKEFAALPFFFARSARYTITDWSPQRGIIRRADATELSLHFGRKPLSVLIIIDNLARDVPVRWEGNKAVLEIAPALLEDITYLQVGVEEPGQRYVALLAWKVI